VTATEEASLPLEMMHWSMHSYGAMFCEVRVKWRHRRNTGQPLPGFLRQRAHHQSQDARSQFRGGIIMGLGLALMEETLFDDRNGRIVNPSLAEYHVPVHLDVPDIDVIWTDIADPHTPMGAHGVGEIGIYRRGGGCRELPSSMRPAGGCASCRITLDKLL